MQSLRAVSQHQASLQAQNDPQVGNAQQIGTTTIISGSSSLPKRKKLNLN